MEELVAEYEAGAITGYELGMQCLHMLDPESPSLVLAKLPMEVQEEILSYARRYDPRRVRAPIGYSPPAGDQVKAAAKWIETRKREQTL